MAPAERGVPFGIGGAEYEEERHRQVVEPEVLPDAVVSRVIGSSRGRCHASCPEDSHERSKGLAGRHQHEYGLKTVAARRLVLRQEPGSDENQQDPSPNQCGLTAALFAVAGMDSALRS